MFAEFMGGGACSSPPPEYAPARYDLCSFKRHLKAHLFQQ